MLTCMKVKNFKNLEEIEIELGKSVVLIGPNNSGKTNALQALTLWDLGLKQWNAKRSGKASPEKRAGVSISRSDLITIPIPEMNLLWRDLRTRSHSGKGKEMKTRNIRIEIIVDGITEGKSWSCGLEFDYANDEFLYCRPLRIGEGKPLKRMPIPTEASKMRVAFLPPMSGLTGNEYVKQTGEIGVLIGQGQTAQVLRNLCHKIYTNLGINGQWKELVAHIKELFGVTLLAPKLFPERAEITMAYKELSGNELDISASGRGLQQTLLLLAHLYANPHTALLLDEPDAHLEVFRQRQTYKLITDVAEQGGSQIIAASHSEVVLNEAADKDIVIAFVGKPHRIDDRGKQVLKALKEIGFDQYYHAEQTGWVLYLEGATDLAILQTFARTLGHKAADRLERPFVYYVGNLPARAYNHFYGLQEAYPDLVGLAIFDRLDRELEDKPALTQMMWQRKELENYLCMEEVLLAYACGEESDDLFGAAEARHREQAMRESIAEVTKALKTLHKPDPWSPDTKVTDDFLDPLFETYFKKLELSNLLLKNDYHILAGLVPKEKIDSEVTQKLDAIVTVSKRAKPMKD